MHRYHFNARQLHLHVKNINQGGKKLKNVRYQARLVYMLATGNVAALIHTSIRSILQWLTFHTCQETHQEDGGRELI